MRVGVIPDGGAGGHDSGHGLRETLDELPGEEEGGGDSLALERSQDGRERGRIIGGVEGESYSLGVPGQATVLDTTWGDHGQAGDGGGRLSGAGGGGRLRRESLTREFARRHGGAGPRDGGGRRGAAGFRARGGRPCRPGAAWHQGRQQKDGTEVELSPHAP